MKSKFVIMSSLIVIFASGSVFATEEAKSKSADTFTAATKKSEKMDRKVACDAEDTNEILSHMIISQVLKRKMIATEDAKEAYDGFKKILQGFQPSAYNVQIVGCSGVLNGGSACLLRVVIPDVESGWANPHDLDVRISRDGKVMSADWVRYRPEKPGVG
ncbi:MAG: hypothetical protein OM95_01660 [Bdellovibrio sp. ArHS]|uniref:hypothetical protein n=1 Tax=Bdellovibrio sp. ArHS TaxID=1569284 RepID=UPI0005836652|nr:hypothetical protein [Bdellovibrio sp. ArHS]KHD89801.1 MAG: hypothetical protein OM95_01660 [Bdellovibrio sp. ArHS]